MASTSVANYLRADAVTSLRDEMVDCGKCAYRQTLRRDEVYCVRSVRPIRTATRLSSIGKPRARRWISSGSFHGVSRHAGFEQYFLNPLLVRVNNIHESLDVVAVGNAGLLLAHLEPRLGRLIIRQRPAQTSAQCAAFSAAVCFTFLLHPVAHFAVGRWIFSRPQ